MSYRCSSRCSGRFIKKIVFLQTVVLAFFFFGLFSSADAQTNTSINTSINTSTGTSIWTTSNEDNKEFIVHDAWNFFLKRFVIVNPDDGINYLDINGLGDDEKNEINAYIAELAAVPIRTYSKKEQLPYWINLYNALVVRLLAENPNIKTMKDISLSGGMFKKSDVFTEKLVIVEGESLSLNDIYHGILRPIWRRPEVHFALYQGSIGGPNLQYDAFTSENIEFLLYRGASHYINHPRGAVVNEKGKLVLSSLFDRYKSDFGGNEEGILLYLEKFSDEPLKEKLNKIHSVDVYAFNESINKWIQKK